MHHQASSASFRSKTFSSSSSFHSRPCQDIEAEVMLGFNGDTACVCMKNGALICGGGAF